MAGAAADEKQRIGQAGRGGLGDRLKQGRAPGGCKPQLPLTADAGELVVSIAARQLLVDGADRSSRWLQVRMERLSQRGQALPEAQRLVQGGPVLRTQSMLCARAQRSSAAGSGSRSGGSGSRPRAVLTKSSQTASPSRVNSDCRIAR